MRSDVGSVAAGDQGIFFASRGFAALAYGVSATWKSVAGKQKCMALMDRHPSAESDSLNQRTDGEFPPELLQNSRTR